MDALVNQIVALSGPTDINQLMTVLRNAESGLQQNHQHLFAGLQNLDPALHSLGVLHFLNAITRAPMNPQGDGQFIDYVTHYLQVCNGPQIRHSADMFCNVCHKYKDQLVAAGCPRRGILPLQAAVRALQPSTETLTPIHADFFQLCLLSKVYNGASGVLEDDIFEVEPARTFMTPTDLFLYSYYGGMLCIGRKQHARALELFMQSLTAPASVGNAIVVAIYKKYLLTSLIHSGQLIALPKFTSSKVRQVVEVECRPYQDLATAYATHSLEKLRKVTEQHAPTFNHDTNTGLVHQVMQSLTTRNIQRLTKTYLTLSLADIAANVGLPSAQVAELHILRMVSEGSIHARVSSHDHMVRFLEDPEQHSSGDVAARIDTCVRRCMKVAGKMQQVHDMVSTDRAYLSKMTTKERSRYDASGDDFGPSGSQGLYQPAM